MVITLKKMKPLDEEIQTILNESFKMRVAGRPLESMIHREQRS